MKIACQRACLAQLLIRLPLADGSASSASGLASPKARWLDGSDADGPTSRMWSVVMIGSANGRAGVCVS